jgi:membrane protein
MRSRRSAATHLRGFRGKDGRVARKPHREIGSLADIGVKGWQAAVRPTAAKFVGDRCTMTAASLAFYWFLAFFPALIALLGAANLASGGSAAASRLLSGFAKALPPGASEVAAQAIHAAATQSRSSSWTAVVAGVIVALWGASSGMSALQQGLDIAYEVPKDRSFLARRLIGIPLMLTTVILGGVGTALIVFGESIGSAIQGHLHINGTVFDIAWTMTRWILAIAAITMLLYVTYRFGPNRRPPRWQWISVGTLAATVIFLLSSVGFSFYVAKFSNFGRTYGTFAGVAIFIFWLFLTGLAFMIGAEFNAQAERQARQEGNR